MASELKNTLEYDLSQEKNFSYRGLSLEEIMTHLATFIARLWQIHVFEEGNTRTTAVFFIKYLKTLGFNVTNDIFAENSWYFRNALVRANYNNLAKGVYETNEYLILFLRNLLLGENNLLSNRQLHINSDQFSEKQDIEEQKQDIKHKKQNIEQNPDEKTRHSEKTQKHITALSQILANRIFSRIDVVNTLHLSASASSELIKKMLEMKVIEKVTGQGKGKYRFR
ncbi:Fic family protein [Exercitatus varius]|uniref:Fic family protein n=1 Tax=Exercitatus varius TaxID=67857 RepID=UPI00294AD55A|nr:Fic family protein [Exercitatus varius]MDG2942887.1 Fic family protein [Exercitatus varius]